MTARLYILIGVFLLALLRVMYLAERIYLWLMLMTASVLVLALLNIVYSLIFIAIRQTVKPDELTAGGFATLILHVRNRGPLPLAHVELWYDTFETLYGGGPGADPGADPGAGQADIKVAAPTAARGYAGVVMPGREAEIRGELFLPYRGSFTPGVIRARLCDLFGLFRIGLPASAFRDRQQVAVLPRSVDTVPAGWGENPFIEGASGGLGELDPYSIAEIRQYRPGDPLKRVHWKVTARTGELQVKEYDGALSPRIVVFLDLSPHGLAGEYAAALEDCMCRNAAAACEAALNAHTPLRLVACAEERLALSGISALEFIAFRRFLAVLRFDSPFDFCEVVRMELGMHPETGNMVIVTAALTPELSDLIASLSAQKRDVSLILVPKDFNAADSSIPAVPEILRPPSPASGPESAPALWQSGKEAVFRA